MPNGRTTMLLKARDQGDQGSLDPLHPFQRAGHDGGGDFGVAGGDGAGHDLAKHERQQGDNHHHQNHGDSLIVVNAVPEQKPGKRRPQQRDRGGDGGEADYGQAGLDRRHDAGRLGSKARTERSARVPAISAPSASAPDAACHLPRWTRCCSRDALTRIKAVSASVKQKLSRVQTATAASAKIILMSTRQA